VGLFTLVVGLGGWIGHTSFNYFDQQKVIAQKNVAIARAEQKGRDLMERMHQMRDQFSDVAGTLERNHRDLVNLLGQNDDLKRDLGTTRKKLRRTEAEREVAAGKQIVLGRQMGWLEEQLLKWETRNSRLRGELDNTKSRLTDAIAKHSAVAAVREFLKGRVKGMENRLAEVRGSQESLLDRVTERTVADIKRVENLISLTGLKPVELLRRSDGETYGKGGPFIAAGANAGGDDFTRGMAVVEGHLGRLKDLRKLLRNLPLIAPVDQYQISSKFGRRRDPFNKKWARHQGLDMSGLMRTPVFSTAPGRVSFVGWKGRFGRMVMVDHGLGIQTRYGHLRRYLVRKGQSVKYRQKIGQLGNSGRSTGAHVHYEILVDGKRVDPIKFMKAGKHVFKE
jgi:murein DD-endopeptidase MepM/ murein hydrolase activator NlpD